MRYFRILCSLILCGVAMWCAPSSFAQDDPAFETGLKPFGSYHGGEIDTVNLLNGNLNVDIPLISYPQQGGKLHLAFALHYQSGGAFLNLSTVDTPDGQETEYVPGDTQFDHGFNIIQGGAAYISQNSVSMDGMGLLMNQVVLSDSSVHALEPTTTQMNGIWRSTDATGFVAVFGGGQFNIPQSLTDSEGTQYFSGGMIPGPSRPNGTNSNSNILFPGAAGLTDTNGNQITVSSSGWTDTMQRSIPFPVSTTDFTGCTGPLPIYQAWIWNLPGVNGGTYPIKFCSVQVLENPSTLPNEDDPNWQSDAPQADYSYQAVELQSVVLPNHTAWTFLYFQDNSGDLQQITFPTGGTIAYTWTPVGNGLASDMNPGGVTQIDAVATRTVSPNDGTSPTGIWHYSYSVTGSPITTPRLAVTTTVTDPLGNDTVHYFTSLNTANTGNATLFETTTAFYQGSSSGGGFLKSVGTDYSFTVPSKWAGTAPYPMFNVVPIHITTTWAGGQTSKIVKAYDTNSFTFYEPIYQYWPTQSTTGPSTPAIGGTFGKIASTQEYDYGVGGPGALLRTTTNSYQYQVNGNYLNANILDLPYSVQVTDGSGAQQAFTSYGYDEAPSRSCVCGNQTSTHHWLNTTGAYLTSTSVYDNSGRVVTTYDPKLNQTTFGYAGVTGCSTGYAGSGPTSVTNALNQMTYKCYDTNTGLEIFTKDANNVTTTTAYDNMLRTTQVSASPGGAQANYCYTDEGGATCSQSGPPYSVVVTEKLTSSVNKTSTAVVDGLGRPFQTQLNSDPEGVTYSQTQYDQLGRKYKVWNPTRCSNPTANCGESSWGFTTTTFDALGRPTLVTKQDGSQVQTSYYGNVTTVTDEAGNLRQSLSDAAGRLIQVNEPGGSGGSFTSGTGSGTVGGSEQNNGIPATPGTGTGTASGSEQNHPGTGPVYSHGSVTIGGYPQSVSYTYDPCSGYDPSSEDYIACWASYGPPYQPYQVYTYDYGTVSITVNGVTCSTSYNSNDSSTSVASHLATAVYNCNPYATASSSGATVYLSSRTGGAVTNYSLSASSATSDPSDFSSPSFYGTPSGSTLTGGADAIPTTYDAGNVWLTVNGAQCSTTYGSNDTSYTVAANLASAVNSCNSYVSASVSGTVVTVTSRTTGSSTNYSLSSGSASTAGFSPSFAVSVSGGALTGGSNGRAPTYDTGNAWVTVNGFQANASYGQSSTSSTVASAIASAFNGNSSSPVAASASGSVITLTAKTAGANTNYSLSQGSSTNLPGTFSGPSFTISLSGSSLTGGQTAGQYALATPTVTTYSYDVLDDLAGVVQGGSHSRSFVYNSLKQLTQSTNPESGTVNYTYDADGNVLTKTDGRGIVTCYGAWNGTSCDSSGYDGINELLKKSYSDSEPTVTYGYGGSSCLGGPSPCYNVGRRTSMTDAGGTEYFAYDPMGRETVEQRTTNGVTKTTSYSYNLDGSLATLTYPTGRTITYTPDSAGRPSIAKDVANGITYASGSCANGNGGTGACYDPGGAMAQMQYGPNLVETMVYNTRLQPCWLYSTTGTALAWQPTSTNCNSSAAAGTILDLKYSFNLGAGDNGNVIGIANDRDTTRSQTFLYDTLNRLVGAGTVSPSGANCWGEKYNYDAWANLTSISAQVGYTGCVQESGMSISAGGNNRISSFSYDGSGNTLSDSVYSYAWNAESEMSSGAGVNYVYDGDGNRVEKSNGKLYWYGAGTEILDESDLSGTATAEYVFFRGKRIAMRTVSSGTVYYYAEDFLGSSRTMVQSGATSACFDADFYPLGGERDVVTTCNPVYKFEGKERDTETGNDDFGARYYSSRFGRWESADWSAVPAPVPYANLTNPQTLNLYAMVSDNPETFADLDGHQGGIPSSVNLAHGSVPLGSEDYMVVWYLWAFNQIVFHTRAPNHTQQQEQINQVLTQNMKEAVKDLKAAFSQVTVKADIGVGIGVKGKVAHLEGKAEAAYKAGLEFSDGKMSVFHGVDLSVAAGKQHREIGLGVSAEKVLGSANMNNGEWGGPEPGTGEYVLGLKNGGTENGASRDTFSLGAEGGELELGGGEVSITREGLSDLQAAWKALSGK